MMLKRILLLCLIPMSGWAQMWMGNGGEGIRDGQHLYIRDLFERDLHHKAFFGSRISEKIRIQTRVPTTLNLTENQKNLLLRKLTDIEERFPCLGVTFARAINLYFWETNSRILDLLPEEGAIRHYPNERRVQIANRILDSIQFHQDSWNQLSDQDRVVLIIHEVVYAMIHPELIWHSYARYRQNASNAREIVASFFSKSSLMTREKRKLIVESLGLPSMGLQCDTRLEKVTLSVTTPNEFFRERVLNNLENPSYIWSEVRSICNVVESSREDFYYSLQVSYLASSTFRFTEYPTSFQLLENDFLQLQLLPAPDGRSYATCPIGLGGEFIPKRSCSDFLTSRIQDWLAPERRDQALFPLCTTVRRYGDRNSRDEIWKRGTLK